jgi:uncharacterized membrane protein
MVATQKAILPFRLRYVILPLAMLLISVIVVAFFYRILPADVAYRFENGAPGGWLSRGAIITGTLATQVVLTILAIAIVWVTIRVSARFPVVPTPLVDRLLTIMGNMVALPQIVLAFAMLNIFSYNAYQIQLISPLVFALLVAALGLIALGVLFSVAVRQLGASRGKS